MALGLGLAGAGVRLEDIDTPQPNIKGPCMFVGFLVGWELQVTSNTCFVRLWA